MHRVGWNHPQQAAGHAPAADVPTVGTVFPDTPASGWVRGLFRCPCGHLFQDTVNALAQPGDAGAVLTCPVCQRGWMLTGQVAIHLTPLGQTQAQQGEVGRHESHNI